MCRLSLPHFLLCPFTFPSAVPNTICCSGGQMRHVTALCCINLLHIVFLSPLQSAMVFTTKTYIHNKRQSKPSHTYTLLLCGRHGKENRFKKNCYRCTLHILKDDKEQKCYSIVISIHMVYRCSVKSVKSMVLINRTSEFSCRCICKNYDLYDINKSETRFTRFALQYPQ